jgi:hypothetical protein
MKPKILFWFFEIKFEASSLPNFFRFHAAVWIGFGAAILFDPLLYYLLAFISIYITLF